MRKLILPEEAAEIMDRRTLEKDEEALIFSGTEGGLLSPSNYNKKLKRWLKEAGITKKLHTHSLRGTFGTFLLEHGVSMEDVSVILGHKQQRTTEKYYSTITDLRRTSASLLANEQFDMLTAFDRGAGAIV